MTDSLALLGMVLVALATLRWGRRGAVLGYAVGVGVCVAAWIVAAWLTTRLDGTGQGRLGEVLADGVAPALGLVAIWLLTASPGVVLGALARMWLSRRRAARARR